MTTHEQDTDARTPTSPGAAVALVVAVVAVPIAVAIGRGTERPFALVAWLILGAGALAWVPVTRAWPAVGRRWGMAVALYAAAAVAILLG